MAEPSPLFTLDTDYAAPWLIVTARGVMMRRAEEGFEKWTPPVGGAWVMGCLSITEERPALFGARIQYAFPRSGDEVLRHVSFAGESWWEVRPDPRTEGGSRG